MCSPNNSIKSLSLISSDKFPIYNISNPFWPRIVFFGFLNFAHFVGRGSDFFEIAVKVVVFGFVAVDVFGVVVVVDDDDDDDDDDDYISDAAVVAVGSHLLLVRVV